MKRPTLLFIGLAAVASSWAGEPIFSTELNTQEEFDLWSFKDNNDDGYTWKFSPDNDPGKRTYYSYSSTNKADDWLISPAVTPGEDGSYIVRYNFAGSSYGESMNVYMAGSADLETLKANLKAEYPVILSDAGDGYFLFQGKAGESVHIAFQACSEADRFRLYLSGVTVERCDNPVDIAVTRILSPVSGEGLGAEPVSVEVKNCGFTNISSFTVNVSLNGKQTLSEEIEKTLAPGETAEIQLKGTLDLSVSHSNYTVSATAVVADDVSMSNNTATAVIRHVGPAVEPYFMGFEPDEDTSDIKFVNVNDDSGDWGIEIAGGWMNLARTGVGCIGYNYDKENNADDWAILDGVKVEAGHHVLKFWVSGDDNHNERLSVHYGNAATPEAMTTELTRLDPFRQGAYQEVICIFELEEAQTLYIGFHAFSDKDENWITLDDVSLEKISSTEADLVLSNISAPEAYLPDYASRSVTFTVRNVGVIDAPATAKLYAGNTLITSQELTVKAQEIRTVTLDNALASLAPGNYEIKVEIESAADSKTDNNTATTSVRVLGTPDISYDFEDEEQFDDLTFRVEDSATLRTDDYGTKGFFLQEISKHPMFGTGMLGSFVWFTDETASADRWIVFPQMRVLTDDACVTWNAGAVNTYGGTESYSLKVSDEGDVWYDYETGLKVASEGTTRATRGVELGKYKDMDVYVAVNVTSKDGYIITFDNFQFFGCSKVNSGIGNVSADADGVSIAAVGDALAVSGTDSAVIEVFDMTGASMLRAEGVTADVSPLAPGVYVARATTAGTTVSVKFVRR